MNLVRQHAKALLANGYRFIPIIANRKAPGTFTGGAWHALPNWTQFTDRQPTPDECRLWAESPGGGIGLTCGHIVGIDIDILDEYESDMVEGLARQHLGTTPLIRFGLYPKRLLVYRCEASLPTNKHKPIEILGRGAQFVAYGIHEVTGRPYYWPEKAPHDVRLEDIPLITAEKVEAFLTATAQLFPDLFAQGSRSFSGDEWRLTSPLGVAAPLEAVEAALAHLPNETHDWDEWKRVAMSVYAACGDEGESAFHAFSERCGAGYDAGQTAAAWSQVRRSPPDHIGAGTLFYLAAQHGFDRSSAPSSTPADDDFAPADVSVDPSTDDGERVLSATPFRPDESVPPREWIYGRHYIRKFLSGTVAVAGLGKSTLVLAEALSMAAGRDLLDAGAAIPPRRVWYYNLEDPADELQRRIRALVLYHGMDWADLGDRLYVDSGRDQALTVAKSTRDGVKIHAPVVHAVRSTIIDNKIDVLIVDPFVDSHLVAENSNDEIKIVARLWSQIANDCDCSIELVHHTRKLNGQEASAEDSRGGSAFVGVARSVRALSGVSEEDAQKQNLPGEHWAYFYITDGSKANLAPPSSRQGRWFKKVSVDVQNATIDLPSDQVGIATRYTPPVIEVVSDADACLKVQLALTAKDRRCRVSGQSRGLWVGHMVAEAMNVDVETHRETIKRTMSAWKKAGFIESDFVDFGNTNLTEVYICGSVLAKKEAEKEAEKGDETGAEARAEDLPEDDIPF